MTFTVWFRSECMVFPVYVFRKVRYNRVLCLDFPSSGWYFWDDILYALNWVKKSYKDAMPSPSDSSSVASMSGSRGLSGSRRAMSGRTSARVLLYLGLCHLALGAMVLAFSFTSLAFTSSPRVRQSCPFWAGFFVSFFFSLHTNTHNDIFYTL